MLAIKKVIVVSAISILILANSIAVAAQVGNPPLSPLNDPAVRSQIKDLETKFTIALHEEQQKGETKEIYDPIEGKQIVLTGASAVKISSLWELTANEINRISARSVEDQTAVINFLKTIESSDITYLDQIRTPYNKNAILERYQTDELIYTVDISTNQIVEIFLVDDRNYSIEPKYTPDELEREARETIKKVNRDIDLETLVPIFGDKEGKTYFFRWENPAIKLEDGTLPFVQVGLSLGGDFLNYVNTLSIGQWASQNQAGLSTQYDTNQLNVFTEVYANGGTKWTLVQGSMSVQSNAGYCGPGGGSCTPTNFYYKATCLEQNCGGNLAKGRWSPNTNPSVKASAYVPSTHATTLMACYSITHSSGTTGKCINQSAYYNTWVSLLSNYVNNISRVELTNANDYGGGEVAWDEIWVYSY
jgi:hypothetical protein